MICDYLKECRPADKTEKAYINDSRARQKVTVEASKPGATSILVLVEHAWGHRASLTHFHPHLYLGSLNITFSLKTSVQSFVRVGLKKNWEKAVRLTALGGRGDHPPLSLTTSICENFGPFLSFIKRQNNPKYGNLSRNFHIFLTASGEGVNPSGQPDCFFPVFFFDHFPNAICNLHKCSLQFKKNIRH